MSSKTAKMEEEEFDPEYNREIKDELSNGMGFIIIIKASFGIGVVVMPDAFKVGGYVVGIFLTFFTGVIIISGTNILLRNMYKLCVIQRVNIISYGVAMQVAFTLVPKLKIFRKCAKYTVYAILLQYHFSVGCTYVLLIAESMRRIVDFEGKEDFDLRFFDLAVLLPLLVLFTITSSKILTYLSVFGFILQLISIALYLEFIHNYDDSKTVRVKYASLSTLPMLYGEAVYILEGFGVILAVQERIRNRRMFTSRYGLVNKSLLVVMFINIGLGFLGYWTIGEDVKKSVLLNMPHSLLQTKVSLCLYSVGLLITFNLQGMVLVNILFHHTLKLYIEDYNYDQYECTMRASIAIATVFGAMAMSSVYHFIPLAGAFCLSLLALVFPGVIDYCVRYPDNYGPYSMYKIRDILMMVLGSFMGVCGLFSSLIWSLIDVPENLLHYFGDDDDD